MLPILTLTITQSGSLIRMMRASSIEVLRQEYVTHARAKGLSERTVLLRHVFPNAFAPTLTLVGLSLGHLLGGIAVIETVFTLPGLGRLIVEFDPGPRLSGGAGLFAVRRLCLCLRQSGGGPLLSDLRSAGDRAMRINALLGFVVVGLLSGGSRHRFLLDAV